MGSSDPRFRQPFPPGAVIVYLWPKRLSNISLVFLTVKYWNGSQWRQILRLMVVDFKLQSMVKHIKRMDKQIDIKTFRKNVAVDFNEFVV